MAIKELPETRKKLKEQLVDKRFAMEHNFKEVNINTERLEIRNLAMSDLGNFLVYRSDPDVTKYQALT